MEHKVIGGVWDDLFPLAPKPRRPRRPKYHSGDDSVHYKRVEEESKGFNEHNDCTVYAMAIATGESYEDCHAALELYGRKHREGTYNRQMTAALSLLGYRAVKYYPTRDLRHTKLFREYFKSSKCSYIVTVPKHHTAFKDGDFQDYISRACRARKVKHYYRIEKKTDENEN